MAVELIILAASSNLGDVVKNLPSIAVLAVLVTVAFLVWNRDSSDASVDRVPRSVAAKGERFSSEVAQREGGQAEEKGEGERSKEELKERIVECKQKEE